MADETYGTLDKALEQFASDARKSAEAPAHFSKLLIELREVRKRGLALKFDGVETQETLAFWSQAGGRGLSASDFKVAEAFLVERLRA